MPELESIVDELWREVTSAAWPDATEIGTRGERSATRRIGVSAIAVATVVIVTVGVHRRAPIRPWHDPEHLVDPIRVVEPAGAVDPTRGPDADARSQR
jgi:hypothetical protein